MNYYMIEKLGILFCANGTNLTAEFCAVETIEMNCVKIHNRYYKRGIFIDESVQEIIPIDDKPFDDFDLQEQCEEYYSA